MLNGIPYGDIEKVKIKREKWIKAVQKGRADFVPDTHANHYVCSIDIVDGEPTYENPYTTNLLTPTEVEAQNPKRAPKRPAPTERILLHSLL